MTTQTQLTLDRVLRVVISIGLVLSVLGTPAFVPLAQAKTSVAQPLRAPEAAEPKLEGTPVVVETPPATPEAEATPTPQPTPVVEPVTPMSVMSEERSTATESVWQILLEQPKGEMKPIGLASQAGTQLTTTDGRVKLEFPANALEGTAEVSYGLRHAQAATEPERTTSLIEFDLEATRTDAEGQKEAVTHFKQPLTLTVNLQGLLDLEHIPAGYYVYLYTLTPEGYQNPVWPITIDSKAGTISAQVDHFSGWGVGITPGTPGVWEFHYTPPEAALYPGAATLQIPFKVPSGRGGLQPNIGISYNSAALNGLSGSMRGTRDWTRGGELGGFWNLDGSAKIAREKWGTCVWVQDNGTEHWATCMQDVFTLILGGTGYELVPAVPGKARGRYYAVGAPNLYIYRNNWCQSYDTNDGECNTHDATQVTTNNESKDYWTVRTADGTEIRFGYNEDSEQMTGGVCNPHWWGGENCKKAPGGNLYEMGYKGEYYPAANNDTTPYRVPRAWWADKWTDLSGNKMEASYYTYWYDNGERVTPKEIKYNSVAGGSYLSRVKFEGHAEIVDEVNPPDNEPVIDRVEIFTTGADNNEYLVRKYLFAREVNYRTKWVGNCASTCGAIPGNTCGSGGSCQAGVDYGDIPSYFEVLKSVQEQSSSGVRLPAQTFDYVWHDTAGWRDIQQLSSVDNGYGAITTFTYGGVVGGYCSALGCNDAVVTSRKVSAGAGTPDLFTTYDYGAACFDAPWTACKSRATTLCEHCNNNAYARLAGFSDATVTNWTDAAMTTALARSKHYFKNANPAYFLGKEYKVQTLDPANNNAILAVQDTTWSGASNSNGLVWWAYVADQTTTRFSGEIGDSTRKSYSVGDYNETASEYDYGAGLRVLNAGFDIDTGSLANWTTYYGGSPVAVTTMGEIGAFAGRYVLKFSGDNTGGVYQDVSGLVPGATYKARVRVKWSSPTASGTFRLRLHDTFPDPNPNNSQSSSRTNPGDGNWKTVEVIYPADWTGAVRLHLDYQVASNDSIYVDEVELARLEDIGDEKSTHYGYVYNEASNVWIIAKNSWRNDYEGITPNGGPGLKFQTLLYYDNATVYNQQTLTHGRLTKMEEGLGATRRTVQYGYDTSGNTTSITDAEGRVSTAEYDTNQYNSFVTRVALAGTNPVQQRTYTWDKVLGVMLTQTGPDGAVTSYAYDTFGRLKKVAQPPDTLTYPTVEYAYYDGGDQLRNSDASGNPVWPLMIATRYRAQAGVAACSGGWGNWERKFIDGLGRVVESQGPGPDWDCTNTTQQGKEVNQYTLYNALGQAVESSVPYHVPQYVEQTINGYILTPYRAPDLSQARSKTVYDTLGTAVRSYGTDGASGTTLNINRLGVTEGATGQIGLGFTDGRGLMTAVDQTLITWPAIATPDDFSDNVLTGWTQVGASESGGTARILGNGSDWANRIYRGSLSDGDGVAFSFKSDGSAWATLLGTGTYNQAEYRRWGLLLSSSNITLDTYEGTSHKGSVLLPFKANTWYRVVFKVGGNDEFVVAVWERDNPSASAVRREKRGAAWANRAWQFAATSKAGTLQIDDYAELSFKTARYGYDTVGNLTNVWDMTGNNLAQMSYDLYRRKTSMYDKDMGSWSYVYNNVDVLTAQQDANGQWTCFYTDNVDRVTGVKYMTGATNPCPGQTVYDATYGYDANGDVGYRTSASNANAVSTWAYDDRGLVTSESKTVTNGGGPYVTSFAYDSMNRIKSVTYPSGEVVNSNYYAYRPQLSAMNSAANPAGYGMPYVSNLVYDAQGRVTAQTMGNGLAEAWSYDPLNGKLIQHTAGNLLDMRYGYDPVGNVRAVHDARRHDGTNETVRYQYDDLERITGYGTTTLGSVTVRAKGTDSGGLPVMQLRVNGVKVGQWTVTTAYADYTAQVPLSGEDWIDVIYTNDAGARNLYVDYVVVGGVAVQAEDTARVVYDTGSGLLREALDGLNVIPSQELMAWPGALRLRVKNAWTPAEADTFSYDDTGNLTMGTESRTYGTTPTGPHVPCVDTGVGKVATLPHAVSQIGSKAFTYDCVGNMLTRQEGVGPTTYTQAWTPDNKLKSVTVNGQTTEFKYDADGNRVMRVQPDGSRTVYVSGQFEVDLILPAAPSNLIATQASASQINLAWTDNSNNESGFNIERSSNGVNWTPLTGVGINATSYQNISLTCGTTYHYRVYAYNAVGNSPHSNTSTATTATCPTPPPSGQLFGDNFNDGQLSSAWTLRNGTWSEANGVLAQTSSGYADPRKAIISNSGVTFPSNHLITAKVRVDSWTDGPYARAGVGLFTDASGLGYNLMFNADHSTIQFLDDYVAYGPSYTFAWTTGTWYWFKLKMENGTLYGKVWQDGTTEPTTWLYSWTRSGRTGYPALNGGSASASYGAGNSTVSFDDVSVAEVPDLTRGLVGLWQMDEGTGTTAYDSSGNGNQGTIVGATATTDHFGQANRAYHFDGVNDYIVIASSNSLALTSTATFAMWVNVANDINYGVSGGPHLFSKGATYGALWADYAMALGSTNSTFEVTDNANSAHFATLSVITRSQWIHVAQVYQNGTVTLYQNGVQVTQPITSYSPMRTSTQPLYLAHRYLTNEAGAFKGALDEVRLYNRALSSTEIQALASLPDNPPTPTPTPTTSPTPTRTPTPTPTPNNLPSAPSNLNVAWSECRSQLQLWWTDNSSNEDGFRIERALEGGGWSEVAIVESNVTTALDDIGWNMNVNYSYRVRAYNDLGNSDYSNVSHVFTSCEQAGVQGSGKALLSPKSPSDLLGWLWRIIATYVPSAKVALAPLPAMSTPSNGVIWRTYYAGAVREKTATTDNLYYVYGDALNSASLTTNSTGGWVGEQRYKPFGEPRLGFPQGDLHTDRRFTGQRSEETSLGSLYDYNARIYSPVLGRFLSADTIVPSPANPQAFNRYAYTLNNPVKYNDPTGHIAICVPLAPLCVFIIEKGAELVILAYTALVIGQDMQQQAIDYAWTHPSDSPAPTEATPQETVGDMVTRMAGRTVGKIPGVSEVVRDNLAKSFRQFGSMLFDNEDNDEVDDEDDDSYWFKGSNSNRSPNRRDKNEKGREKPSNEHQNQVFEAGFNQLQKELKNSGINRTLGLKDWERLHTEMHKFPNSEYTMWEVVERGLKLFGE